MTFRFEVPKQARLNPDAFKPELLAALRKTGKALDKRLGETTATWEGEKPKFETRIHLSAKEASLQPAMLGSDKAKWKWRWLDEGTRVRYAIMSRNWKSKTTPGFVGSGPGAGEMVHVDVDNPQPGIKARRWSKLVLKEFRPIFGSAMRAAMRAGAARANRM